MPYPTVEQIVEELVELRPLSPVAQRIITMTEHERFSAHELAGEIASDPALTARMLRLANSAYYGFPRQIATVRDAVVLLGFRAVRATALTACLVDTMPRGPHIDDHRFWRHSLAVGMLAELLARSTGIGGEEAFTAGVLHNIGRLALDQQCPEGFAHARRHAAAHGITLAEAQYDVLGFHDATLGGALCERWGFPAPLVQAVARHRLDPASLPEAQTLTAAVVRARLFARANGIDDGVEEHPAEAVPEPEEAWAAPPLSLALDRIGGIEGVSERIDAFFGAAA